MAIFNYCLIFRFVSLDFLLDYLVDIDDCKESPCNNGGECQDGIASYTCICPLGYTGPDCEKGMFE